MKILTLAFFVAGQAIPSTAPLAGHWPAWRGPEGSGVTTERNLPTTWNASENVRWKIPLPDRGNSTPIVWGDRIFLTQAVEKEHLRSLICLAREDGRTLWTRSVTYTAQEQTHEDNPPGSASPVSDGERVIVSHGSAGVHCYDFEGRELWRRELGAIRFVWGYAVSPVLHGGVCIVYVGPGTNSSLVGLDKKTGKTVWKYEEPPIDVGKRTDGFRGKEPGIICTYSTPIVVRSGERDELIMSFPRYVRAFDPATGRELWHCDGLNPLVYTSPIHGEGIVVAMGGYQGNTIAVRAGGSGDVTETHRLWQNTRTRSGIGSGLVHDGHIYILNSGGIAECIELKTGKTVWLERPKTSGPSGDSWSSMVRSGDNLYILNKSGDCIVLKASPKFELISANSIGNEPTNASIVPSKGEFFIRTYKHLWCIGEGKKTAAL